MKEFVSGAVSSSIIR